MKRSINSIILVLVMVLMMGAPVVYGQVSQPPQGKNPPPESKWQFTLIPFMWAPTIESKVTVGGYEAKNTTTFSDIWRNLAGAGMVHFEAKKDNLGFFFEPTYMKIRADATFEGRRDSSLPVIPRDLTITYEQWMVEFGAFYQIGKWPVGQSKDQFMTVSLLAGGRYWWVSADLDTTSVINPGGTDQWIDPIVGAQLSADLTKQLTLYIKGDIGGFGVGSDFTWNAVATLGYRFSDQITGLLGYRALYIDYKPGSGNTRYEETIHGPVMGIAFAF